MLFYSSNKFTNYIEAILTENADNLHLFTVKQFYEHYELLAFFIDHCEAGLSETPDKGAFLRNEQVVNSLDKYFNDLSKIADEIRTQAIGFKDATNSINLGLTSVKPLYANGQEAIHHYTLYILGYTKAFYVAYLKDVQELGIEAVRQNIENAKKETEKLAWLYELGILELIKDRCTGNSSTNYTRAGKVIASFTDIKADTARKALDALYSTNPNNKNNPTNGKSNKEFVLKRLKEFKLEILHKEFKKQDSF